MAALAASTGLTEDVERAIRDVAALGDEVVPELEQLLRGNHSANVREAAARALAEIGTPRAISLLLEVVLSEQDDDQRRALVSALHALDNSSSAGELALALTKFRDTIALPTVRDTLARVADEAGTRAIAQAFHEAAPEGWQQSNLMGALVRVRSSEAVPALSEVLSDDSDSALRSQAAIALAMIGTHEAIQALLNVLAESRSTALTGVVAESLGAVNNKESLPDLVVLLNQSTNEIVRFAVATALGNIPSHISVNALQASLQTEASQTVRQSIEAALNRLNQANASEGY